MAGESTERTGVGPSYAGASGDPGSGGSLGSLHPDDEEICRRIRAGDAAAEEALVVRFHSSLSAIACLRAGRDNAPDHVQETLTAALVNLRRGAWRGEGPLSAYLAAILRRSIARQHLAAAGVLLQPVHAFALPDPGADQAVGAEQGEERVRVHRALARLSHRHREVLVRHYLEDQSVEEIAAALGVPRGTVLSRLYYARRRLVRTLRWRSGAAAAPALSERAS